MSPVTNNSLVMLDKRSGSKFIPCKLSPYPLQKWDWACLAVFCIAGLVAILNHAMWRDELNGWLIARDSPSWGEFIGNIRYEGHPMLWYLCLRAFNQITANPVAMQLFHWGIGAAIAALWLYYAPFPRWQVRLWLFGYLPFYEFLSISRNYSLGLLGLVLFCVCFETRKQNYLYLAIILTLMANANAYSLLIACSLGILLVADRAVEGWQSRFSVNDSKPENRRYYRNNQGVNRHEWLSFVLATAALALAVWTLLPPADSSLQGGASQWYLSFDLQRFFQSLNRIWSSYILILVPSDRRFLDAILFSGLSFGLFAAAIALLIDRPLALLFYLIATGLILSFTYLKFLGSQRHYGHLYLVLMASLWLAHYYPKSRAVRDRLQSLPRLWQGIVSRWLKFIARQRYRLIGAILVFQLIGGFVSYGRDLTLPYSASRETAQFLKQARFKDRFLVGSEDFAVAPISGYLQRSIYYPESRSLGSFVLFNQQRNPVNDGQILERITDLLPSHPQGVSLILNHPLDSKDDRLDVLPLAEFTRSFIHNEQYYLYEITNARS